MGHMGELKNAYKILIGNTWSKDQRLVSFGRESAGLLQLPLRG